MTFIEIQQKFEQILKKNGLLNEENGEKIKSLTIQIPERLRNEHMASICEYYTITTTNGQNVDLFIKKQSTNQKHLMVLRELNVFEKEACFYNVLLGDLEELYLESQKSVKPARLDFIPKCLYADEELIVLENLVPKGYVMNSKVDRQNIETARMVLKNLAQLHSLSYKMICDLGKKTFYDKYPFLEEKVMIEKGVFIKELFEKALENVTRILYKYPEMKGSRKVLLDLDKLKNGKLIQMISDLASLVNSRHLLVTVNHGDFWNNNMMFKSDSSGNYVHNMLVDFQFIRLGSPNIDVGYYIFTSLHKNIRRKYWQELLKYYLEELKRCVEELGRSFNYTFQGFLKDYKEKSVLGFWFNICFIAGVTHETLEHFDLEKLDVDLAEHFSRTVEKWIEDHPEKCETLAMELIECFEDFQEQQLA